MKKRWKGLCALWMVLALVVGAVPVKGAAEGVPEPAPVAVSEDAGDDGRQAPSDSGTEESSVEDGTEKDPEQSTEPEESETDRETVRASEEVSEESEKESEESEESSSGGETSLEESSLEESSLEESSPEDDSQEEILEPTDLELLENTALPFKAAAREAAVSGDGWLYVDSGQVESGGNVGGIGEGDSSIKKKVTVQFDESLNEQSWSTVPTGKRLKAWELWEFDQNGNVTGKLGELEAAGKISAEDYQSFNIDGAASFLLIVPIWINAEDILDGDFLEMDVGDSCNLLEGKWKVVGDNTIYNGDAGGRTVYAAKSGTFTFQKIE